MNKLSEWFQKIPTWITGAISFLSAIIGFFVLIQENYYIGITVLTCTIAVTLLLIGFYIRFAKTPPLIEGGKGVYLYPKYRAIGLSILILMPIFFLLLLTSKQAQNVMAYAIYGTPTATSLATTSPHVTMLPMTLTASPNAIDITNTPFATPAIAPTISSEFINVTSFFPKAIEPEANNGFLCHHYMILNENESFTDFESLPENFFTILEQHDLFNEKPMEIMVSNNDENDSIRIENKLLIKIISFQPLKQLRAIGARCNEGGGNLVDIGVIRNFPDLSINQSTENETYVTRMAEYPFFVIKPGEFEVFNLVVRAKQPGIYKFQLGFESTQKETDIVWLPENYALFSPEILEIFLVDTRQTKTMVFKDGNWEYEK
ncbi:MAG: hypothetical protein KJZ72_02620 [Anaerolineales bacterium]|nr:hypothetical protein [Anaerolineales bacterium]